LRRKCHRLGLQFPVNLDLFSCCLYSAQYPIFGGGPEPEIPHPNFHEPSKDTAQRAHYEMGSSAMKIALKSAFIAAAILVPASIASAQPAKSSKPPERLDINQIIGMKKVDATTYDISAKLEDGTTIDLRMNTFVVQDLSRQLGNFGR
jgi:hypothetical protein